MPADADSPLSRHLPPIPAAWLVGLDAFLIGLASMAASIIHRYYRGLTPSGEDILPNGPRGAWLAWTAALCLLLPLTLLILEQYRVARDVRNGWSFTRVLTACAFTFGGLWLFLYFQGSQPIRDADVRVLTHLGLTVVLLTGWRAIASRRLRRAVVTGKRVRNVLLVGDDVSLETLGRDLVGDSLHGRRIVGFVRANPLAKLETLPKGTWMPAEAVAVETAVVENSLRQPRHLWAAIIAHTEGEDARLIDGLGVEELLLSNRMPDDEIASWIALAQARGVDAHLVPYSHERLGIVPRPWLLGDRIVLDIHRRPMDPFAWAAKRTMDVVLGSIALVLVSPLILLAAIAIKLENPRSPVFYGGTRVGLKGRHFRQWKLATMRPDADKFRDDLAAKNAREGPWFQLDEVNDPRISKVGRLLRKYSLNDLPQFWNVVWGTMSLVGPRPLAADEASRFVKFDFRYYQCFDVKPGITGLWQVSNRMVPSFEYRFKLDMQYIQNWSLWLDLKLMVMTPVAMLGGGR